MTLSPLLNHQMVAGLPLVEGGGALVGGGGEVGIGGSGGGRGHFSRSSTRQL